MRKFFYISAVNFLICILLVGCSISEPRFPRRQPAPKVDIAKIPDAIPRHEPKSRYGNPKSYVVFGRRYHVMRSARGYVETGIASWYGPNFHGKKTSTQEVYDMNKMTAAHTTLPIPSYVEVTNLRNGRKVIVRVNDRGPFHDNRIIDLSYVAAAKLDIIKAGTGKVEIRAIDPANLQAHRQLSRQKHYQKGPQQEVRVSDPNKQLSQPVTGKQMYIQLGSFSEIENAKKFRNRIQKTMNQTMNRTVSIATAEGQEKTLYRVRIGPIADLKAADLVIHDLNDVGLYDHHVLFQ